MKINPLDKLQPAAPALVDKSAKKPQQGPFSEVLDKAVQNAQHGNRVSGRPLQGLLGPSLTDSHIQNQEALTKVQGMLDALERYQHLLGDPNVNLRGLQANINQLKAQIDTLQPMLQNMPREDGLQQLLNETLIVASKEIGRFEKGDYVD